MLDEDELVGNWTLVGDELALLSNRRAPTKLAFALMLRFYALHGRFPKGRHELPDEAVGYVARLVKVADADLALYEWDGQTSKSTARRSATISGFGSAGLPTRTRWRHGWPRMYATRSGSPTGCGDAAGAPVGGEARAQVTLLAAYLYCRGREITDTLVDLLIATVHRINARAETKVVGDFVAELKRVSGKENILFKMTEATLEAPEDRVEDVIYPAVPGGYKTLVTLLHEYKTKRSSYRQHKQRVFKASYTKHYRTGLIQIIEVLEFGSTNTVHAPMMLALALIKRYKAEAGNNRIKCYALGETVPVEGIIPVELVELLYRSDSKRRLRILRSVYECGVFQTLPEKLRCKEIWVVGTERWRNPDDDLPKDYEQRRAENYAKLRKPLDPQAFIEEMRAELDHELSQLNDALGGKRGELAARRNRNSACCACTSSRAASATSTRS
jgi:hypothetical protein